MDRSISIKKPRYSTNEGPSLTELSGYNAKRHEFDPEYDNDAEQALKHMAFKKTDSELKLCERWDIFVRSNKNIIVVTYVEVTHTGIEREDMTKVKRFVVGGRGRIWSHA